MDDEWPSAPAVVLDSMSPSYVGESIPSESERRLEASWCLVRPVEEGLKWDERAPLVLLCLGMATGTETADAPSSVRGSLSSSDLYI